VKIIRLDAENVKRLRAVSITPDGNVQVIAGRNAQGKSSVLDSIWYALGGGAAQKGTARPVRDGESSAFVRLDLGDLVVTRSWVAGGRTSLKVEAADGAKYSSPQGMLDSLVGRLSFDPLAFSMLDEKAQLADLLALIDLPFDLDTLDAERRGCYDERTVKGREVARLQGLLDTMPHGPGGLPPAEVSVAVLLEELRVAQGVSQGNAAKRAELESTRSLRRRWYEQAAQLDEKLKQALQTIDTCDAKIDALAAETAGLVEPDHSGIAARIDGIEATNRAVRDVAQRRQVAEEHASYKAAVEELTGEIEKLDRVKTTALSQAVFPVDGLGFDPGGVTYGGVPFRQCSSAERLRVSLGMAMAMSPGLRVILIRDGSLLDSTNMALIEEMAAERDYQVWLEVVREDGAVGVVIEDGQVVESDVVPPVRVLGPGDAPDGVPFVPFAAEVGA